MSKDKRSWEYREVVIQYNPNPWSQTPNHGSFCKDAVLIPQGETTMAETFMNFDIGKNYFIRGINNYYTGKVVGLDEKTVYLTQAAWIADTGRFHSSLRDGEFREVEPYPPEAVVRVSLESICDWLEWRHELPLEPK